MNRHKRAVRRTEVKGQCIARDELNKGRQGGGRRAIRIIVYCLHIRSHKMYGHRYDSLLNVMIILVSQILKT